MVVSREKATVGKGRMDSVRHHGTGNSPKYLPYEVSNSTSPEDSSYLVDPASSHMLVSKIKPCMSKYKHLYCETANGSLNQLSFI